LGCFQEGSHTLFYTWAGMAGPTHCDPDPGAGRQARVAQTIWASGPWSTLPIQRAAHDSSSRVPRSCVPSKNRAVATPPPPHTHRNEAHPLLWRGQLCIYPMSHSLFPLHKYLRECPLTMSSGVATFSVHGNIFRAALLNDQSCELDFVGSILCSWLHQKK